MKHWDELPGPALLSILEELKNPVDFFSFSSVCQSWRAVVTSDYRKTFLASLPPVLFFFHDNRFYNPADKRFCFNRETLLAPWLRSNDGRSFCGYSEGHLILARPRKRTRQEIFLLDPCTREETSGFPAYTRQDNRSNFNYTAFLTKPPSSPDSVLVIFPKNRMRKISCCRRGDRKWKRVEVYEEGFSYATRLVSDGKFLAVSRGRRKIQVVEFGQITRTLSLDVAIPRYVNNTSTYIFLVWLGAAGGVKVFAVFHSSFHPLSFELVLCRLDLVRNEWVEVESLGGRALFMDSISLTCYFVENPEKWGYQADCVYTFTSGIGLECHRVNNAVLEKKGESVLLGDASFKDCFWIMPSLLYPK